MDIDNVPDFWVHQLQTLGVWCGVQEELCEAHAEKIGRQIGQIGATIGPLTAKAADELGLSVQGDVNDGNSNVIVSVGLIDAHSGGVGMVSTFSSATLCFSLTACIKLHCTKTGCF